MFFSDIVWKPCPINRININDLTVVCVYDFDRQMSSVELDTEMSLSAGYQKFICQNTSVRNVLVWCTSRLSVKIHL